MKRTPALALIITLSSLIAGLSASKPAQKSTGLKAAAFTLKGLDGKEVKLADYKGKVVILDFWATWCPPCVKEIPHFNDLARQYAGKGLVVLGLSVDQGGAAVVRKFMQKTPIDYRVAMADEAAYTTYQDYLPRDEQGGIPFTFIIDREGIIRQHFVGYREKAIFEGAIKPLL
ncbi:MAG: TlpA family protein disulfide reductase [Calditrichaeota bacterium]|nr:TlpA family protein disulfide reductase [Calditrichota bacterium]